MKRNKIAIIGAGGWGLALANVFSIEHDVSVWVYEKDEYECLIKNHESSIFLKDIKLNEKIVFTLDIEEAINGKDIVILATPSFALKNIAETVSKFITNQSSIVIVTKGLDIEKMDTMSAVARKYIKNIPILTLSGPSHAEEVARLVPTAVVIAGKSRDKNIVTQTRDTLMISPYLRIYSSSDQKGVEMAGALKNIYAIASGIIHGLNLGDNTKAALITRSLKEMVRFAKHKQAKESTLYGLSGIGDLIVTCMSPLSRNFSLGTRLAKGEKYDDIKKNMKTVAEGVYAAEAVYKYSKQYGINMPIAKSVYNIIFNNEDCKEVLYNLMARKAKNEDEN